MCGVAVPRKGPDIFWEVAKALPEYDFVWIGSWDDDDYVRNNNNALSLNEQEPLGNLYWTNSLTNPYTALNQIDLFTLTSREDPNPLVVLEAIALDKPAVTFTKTGASLSISGFSTTSTVSSVETSPPVEGPH